MKKYLNSINYECMPLRNKIRLYWISFFKKMPLDKSISKLDWKSAPIKDVYLRRKFPDYFWDGVRKYNLDDPKFFCTDADLKKITNIDLKIIEKIVTKEDNQTVLSVNSSFLAMLKGMHLIWKIVKNNGTILLVNHGGPLDDQAHMSLTEILIGNQVRRSQLPKSQLPKNFQIIDVEKDENKKKKKKKVVNPLKHFGPRPKYATHHFGKNIVNVKLRPKHKKTIAPAIVKLSNFLVTFTNLSKNLSLSNFLKDIEKKSSSEESESELDSKDKKRITRFEQVLKLNQDQLNMELCTKTYNNHRPAIMGFFSNSNQTFKKNFNHLDFSSNRNSSWIANYKFSKKKDKKNWIFYLNARGTHEDFNFEDFNLYFKFRQRTKKELMEFFNFEEDHNSQSVFLNKSIESIDGDKQNDAKEQKSNLDKTAFKGLKNQTEEYHYLDRILEKKKRKKKNHFDQNLDKHFGLRPKYATHHFGPKYATHQKQFLKWLGYTCKFFNYCEKLSFLVNAACYEHFATNPIMVHSSLVIFSHAERGLGLVDQINDMQLPLIAIGKNSQYLRHKKLDYTVLSNPQNDFFSTLVLDNLMTLASKSRVSKSKYRNLENVGLDLSEFNYSFEGEPKFPEVAEQKTKQNNNGSNKTSKYKTNS